MTDLKTLRQNCISIASAQQRSAANPEYSVWVEASAGTGKTKVLSDRVLRLLLNGTNPSRILCLTYTKAAASEMNNRIVERLSKWATITDDKLISELEDLLNIKLQTNKQASSLIAQARRLFAILLDTPGGLKIQTIHSFCQEILKRFPLEAKISPYFTIMDERETSETLEQIKLDILRQPNTLDIKEALDYLTSHCSEYTFPKILASITDNCNMLENYFAAHPDFETVLESISANLNLTKSTNKDSILRLFWQDLPLFSIKNLITSLDSGTDVSKENAVQLAAAIEANDFEIYKSVLLTKENTPKKNFLVKQVISKFPETENIYAQECERLLNCLNILCNIDLRDSTSAILTISREILSRYHTYKTNHSKMDYNDLIIKTKNLLNSSEATDWILYKLDGGIDHILIDEAQDTSPDQWAIIKAFAAEFFSGMGSKSQKPTFFAVGDRKQSIYSFQGADVAEFEKMHQWFKQITNDFQTINMEVSFRSTSAILDTVNSVFSNSSAKQGVIPKNQDIRHTPSRIGEGGHVEIWDLCRPQSDINADIWLPPVERITTQSASALLAQKIAELIKKKVTSKELKANGEPLKYSDFLILVQRRNSFVEEMVRACKNIDVNIAGIDKINLNEHIAINDLIAIAKFTLLTSDDLNLACVLKSPLFNLTDDDLIELCCKRKDNSLWQQICQNPKYTLTVQTLQSLINLAQHNRPFEFFSYILNDLQGRRKFIARLSSECEDAIDEFINLTLNFEQDNIPSLQLFIEWMLSDDVEVKRNLEQNDFDAVRLMTVHGSKGLQAPIVILPDTVRIKNTNQEAGWITNKDSLLYPLGKDYYNDDCINAQQLKQNLTLEEYNRLLYVALTRAGEQLYICGYTNKNSPNDQSWHELCHQSINRLSGQNDQLPFVYDIVGNYCPDTKENKSQKPSHYEIPAWTSNPIMPENPLSRPLAPSHQDTKQISALSPLDNDNSSRLYARGNIIHKLLQFIPLQPHSNVSETIRAYLKTQAIDFSSSEQDKIYHEVLSLVENPQFAPLFAPNSLAEVSVMGQVDDRIISGKIDRLVVTSTSVMIVDYKTNRPAARTLSDVPPSYIKQLSAYKQLISRIYPNKKIDCYILWTNTAQMMHIDC